jgi:hypothetical protein
MIATLPASGGPIVQSDNLILVGIVVLAVIAALALGWTYMQRRRRTDLRARFGPEYERTVRETGSPDKAAAVLEDRVRRVERFKIRALSREQADSFAREWKRVQALFVDDPDVAVDAAGRLVTEVMAARGYPIEDFDTRAADLSVDHPRVVENYRIARTLALRKRNGEAGTEELRQAVVNYRTLFDDLLDTGDDNAHHIRRAS